MQLYSEKGNVDGEGDRQDDLLEFFLFRVFRVFRGDYYRFFSPEAFRFARRAPFSFFTIFGVDFSI